MPSYNQVQFLRGALESVLQQGYPKLQLIVRDGGSTDGSVDVLRSYGSRFQWVSESDGGQTAALNAGFAQATGEIIGFLNSDDLLLPNTLWEVAGLFRLFPDLNWVTGDYQIIDEHGQLRDPLIKQYKTWQRSMFRHSPALFPLILGVNNPIVQPSTFWRRDIHDQGARLREDLDLVMDYEWWWQLYHAYGSPLVVPYEWSAFRVHADSKGGKYFAERLNEQLEVAKEYQISAGLQNIHAFHNQVVTWMYERGIS